MPHQQQDTESLHHIQTISASLILRSKEAFVRSVVWAFIGILYGLLFVFFSELAIERQWPVPPYFFSAVLAGTIGALIYSSMRLAVLLAGIISPVCIIIMVLADGPVTPAKLLTFVTPAGAVIGGFYGLLSTGSRVYRADAKTLTGFSAGFLAGLGYLILSPYIHSIPAGVIIGVMCVVTGWLYVLFVPTFIRFRQGLLSPLWDGALVGAGVAVFLGISLYIMTSSVTGTSQTEVLPLIRRIDQLLPQALAGGLLGGAFAGFVSGILLTHWQDL